MPWAYAGCTPPHLSDVVEIKACNTFLMLVPTPNNPGSGSREKGARLQIPVSLITKVDAVNSSRVPQQRSRQHQRPVTSRCSGDTPAQGIPFSTTSRLRGRTGPSREF